MEKSHKIVNAAITYGVIEEKDRNIYTVAVSSLLFSFFTWSTLLLLGVFFQKINGCFIFLLFHIPLRIYAGGYHQKTRKKCYVQSLIIFLLLMLCAILSIQNWIMLHWMILIIPVFVAIWALAPVEAISKPLNIEEREHHKKVARSILVVEVIVIVLFVLRNSHEYLYFSTVSILLVAIELLLGLIAEKRNNRKNSSEM